MDRYRSALWAAAEPLRRPHALVDRVRWLFFVCSIASLALTAVAVLPAVRGSSLLLLAVAVAAFATSWLHRYLRQRTRVAFDLSDVVALMLFASACPRPAVALGVAFPALWYRAVYGRTEQIVAYGVGISLALAGALRVWPHLPGHTAHLAAAAVLGNVPVLLLTVFVMRHLALNLFERDQDRERDITLATLGGRLIGVIDVQAVLAACWVTTEAICRSTPGLRAIVVYDDGGDALRVSCTAGGFDWEPVTLPRSVLPEGPVRREAVEITADPLLTLSSGVSGQWVALPLPDASGGYMLLGAPSRVPREAIVATWSMLGQGALALQTCAAHDELRGRALTDGLTGLANRSAFSAAMAQALRSSQPESWVLFLDLDDFKLVNDRLGHRAGDQLLAQLGTQLTATLRADDVCARLGGDEFAVLLRGADEAVARRIGQRLVELISTPVQLEEGLARIGASVGAAPVRPGSSETLVVHQADVAMYAAKAAGKNRVQFFHPGLLLVDDRAAAEAELRAAVDAGELVLAYQPVLSAADGRCTAVEALVRWAHPERGLLAPAAFLELAEETGVIIALGDHVLRSACRDAAQWEDPDAPVAVHVNASPTQLAHPHFVEVVREALADTGLPAQRLVIEVTESTVLDAPAVSATLDELVRLGVGIALDDFGTGYSALTTLRSLPIDTVKIDKSFVAGALTQAADQAVVEAIVQMAGRLGLATVAEGVETMEQQAFLVAAGITGLQGYLYLRPAPVAEFTAWLADNRRRTSEGELTPA